MAKINITRLPNATPEYNAAQFDQMIRLLDQIVFLLNTNFQQDIKEESESETFFLG
jgi:hypothetical protein